MGKHLGIDGPALRCAFETWWCQGRASLAGGFDEHHEHPLSLGGPESGPLLVLCSLHHRRQHALIRAMVEAESTTIRTARWFTKVERDTAATAVQAWLDAGQPHVDGWPCPAAGLQRRG